MRKNIKTCEFKIGDKVQLKGGNEFLGYVAGILKEHLFRVEPNGGPAKIREHYVIDVHLGGGNHVEFSANELEVYK